MRFGSIVLSHMDAGYRTGFYQIGCNEFKVSGGEPLFNYSVNAIIFILLSACARNIMFISKDLIDLFLEKQNDKKTSRVSCFVWCFFCLILTKICDWNINITCLFIVLVFEEKVNEILTYNAIIVQLILYYYTTLSAVLQLARLKETFRTTVCVLYRKPFSLLELGCLIIINLLRSVDHPKQNIVSHAWRALHNAYALCTSIYFWTGCCRDICSRRAMLLWHRNNASWIVVHWFWHEQPMKPFFHQPPLQLLGRTDQQMLAPIVYEFWAGQLELKKKHNGMLIVMLMYTYLLLINT